ncbi:hypothetical protein D3C72_864020 [compost metagenome]
MVVSDDRAAPTVVVSAVSGERSHPIIPEPLTGSVGLANSPRKASTLPCASVAAISAMFAAISVAVVAAFTN